MKFRHKSRWMASAMALRLRFIGKHARILSGLPAARSASPIVCDFDFQALHVPPFRLSAQPKIAHEAPRAGMPEDSRLFHALDEAAFLWHGSCQYEPKE